MTVFSDNAQKFEEYLSTVGTIPVVEATDWMTENWVGDAPKGGTLNLVLASGLKGKFRKWHREGDVLIWGPPLSPSGPAGGAANASQNILEDPADQFANVGITMGISEHFAKPAAAYVSASYDLWDPVQVWDGLKMCPEINITQRKRWWQTWTSRTQAVVTPELEGEVNRVSVVRASDGRAEETRRQRRYMAVDGEIVLVSSDDESGMSLSEAERIARLQLQARGGAPPTGDPILATLLTQTGETDRKRMEIDQQRYASVRPDAEVETRIQALQRESEARITAMQREFDMRVQLVESNFKHQFELSQAESRHQMEAINHNLERLLTRPVQEEDPITKADKLVPGFGMFMQKAFEKMFNPPQTEAVTIDLGQEGKMSLEAYERIEGIKNQKEMLRLVRENIPQLFELGKDMKEARRRVEEEGEDKGEHLQQATCVTCGLPVAFVGGAFQCPRCQAIQKADGQVVQKSEVASWETAGEPPATTNQTPVLPGPQVRVAEKVDPQPVAEAMITAKDAEYEAQLLAHMEQVAIEPKTRRPGRPPRRVSSAQFDESPVPVPVPGGVSTPTSDSTLVVTPVPVPAGG